MKIFTSVQIDKKGYKGCGLDVLKKNHFNVPDYIVLPSNILNNVFGNMQNVNKSNIYIIEQITKPFIDQNPGETFIVRSSANIEDSPDHSFSGVFETIRDVEPNKVINAVERVLLSVKNDSVRKLANQFSITYSEIKMAVIIQVQKKADIGGVIFSANPINGNPLECVIGYLEGNTHGVVDGSTNSITLKYDRISLEVTVNKNTGNEKLVKNIPEIENSLSQLEIEYDSFVDIEFCISNDIIHWLQVRAIRGLPRYNIFNEKSDYNLIHAEPFTPLGLSIELEKNKIYYLGIKKLFKFKSQVLLLSDCNYLLNKNEPVLSSANKMIGYMNLLLKSNKILADYKILLSSYRERNKQLINNILGLKDLASIIATIKNLINNYFNFQNNSIEIGNLANIYPEIYSRYMCLYKHDTLVSLDELSSQIKEEDLRYLKILLPKNANPHHFTNDNPKDVGWKPVYNKNTQSRKNNSKKRLKIIHDPIRRYLFNKSKLFFPFKDLRNIHFYEGIATIRESLIHLGKLFKERGIIESEDEIFLLSYKDLDQNFSEIKNKTMLARKKMELINRQSFTFEKNDEIGTGDFIKGIACSRGNYTGKVIKMRSLQSFKDYDKIDILFCPEIKPHWYPVLTQIKGLITVNGFPLAHGSNMAREMGIPAVGGIPWGFVDNGEYLSINGSTGNIQRAALPSKKNDHGEEIIIE